MRLSNLKTKATALALTTALCLSSLIVAPNKADAAEYVTLLDQSGDATANTPVNYTFNIPSTTYTYIDVLVAQPVDLTCSITSAGNEKVFEESVLATDNNAWEYLTTAGVYTYSLDWKQPIAGDYNISLTFGADTKYIVLIDQDTASIKMSSSSLVLTKGFSSKLSVSDASGKVKWTSSKSSVAAVSSSGKVTAKKTGSATITATDENGSSAKCIVTVKANTYSSSKLTTQTVTYGNAGFSVHKMSYDKKGNLVINAHFLNNCGKTVLQLKNIKITVKNPSKKVIGTYSLKSKKVSVPQGGLKTFKFTIKKSKLKLKSTQDLRNSSTSTDGQYLTNR